MAIVAVFQSPSFTREQYEEGVSSMMNGKTRPDSPSDWPVKGLLAHIAGDSPTGFRVIDVWDSEESFQKFGETLGPILEKIGANIEPEIYAPLAFVTA